MKETFYAAMFSRRVNQWFRAPLYANTLLGAKREATRMAGLNDAQSVEIFGRYGSWQKFNLICSREYPRGKWEYAQY